MIICLDPGSRKAGVALFETTGTLISAWLVEGSDWRDTADHVASTMPANAVKVDCIDIEKMQIYNHTLPAQANACVLLSLMAGRVTGIFRGWSRDNVVEYLPKTWKGQAPKVIHIERIKAKLSPTEALRVQLPKDKKKQLDVWDAIGIGLFHLRKERAAS